MARLGISYEAVSDKAEQLLKQGINPTMAGVRQALGDTGSLSTIHKHLDRWKTQRLLAVVNEEPEKPIGDEEVSQAVSQVLEQINQKAQQQVKQMQETLAQAQQQFEAEKVNLLAQIQELTESVEAGQTKINHLQNDLTLMGKELAAEKQKAAAALESTTRADQALALLQAQTHSHISNLQTTYNESTTVIKKQASDESTRLITLLENQRTEFMVKVDALTTSKEKLEKRITLLETENKHYQQQLKSAEQTENRMTIEVNVLQKEKEENVKSLTTAEATIITLEKNLTENKTKLDKFIEEAGQLKQIIHTFEQQNNIKKYSKLKNSKTDNS